MASTLLLLLAIFGVNEATAIIGGDDVGTILKIQTQQVIVNPGTFPFIVLVKRDGHACTGVIIKRNAVLTAGHCVDTRPRATMSVWAGILHRQLQIGQGQEITVKTHSLFREKQTAGAQIYEDDIAILWLESLLTIVKKQVEVARLPHRDFMIDDKNGLIAGWGMKDCGSQTFMLQKTTLTIISQDSCQRDFSHPITNKVFCAISGNRLSTISFGDSGSPFVVDGLLVGISSYGSVIETKYMGGRVEKKCDSKKPAVFTSIPVYLDWIRDEVSKHPIKRNTSKPTKDTSNTK